jgi:hypothetical protein
VINTKPSFMVFDKWVQLFRENTKTIIYSDALGLTVAASVAEYIVSETEIAIITSLLIYNVS